MCRDPFLEQGEAKFAFRYRLQHEFARSLVGDTQIKFVQQQESMHRSEPHPLVAVQKGVVIHEGLEQSSRFFA